MEETIKTTLYKYRYNTDKPAEAEQYKKLREKLEADPNRDFFNCISLDPVSYKGIEPGKVQLETNHIFNNQWNTASGYRVFDWYEEIYQNRDIKEGHYLDITPEMITARQDNYKCGYCGKQYYKPFQDMPKKVFCDNCLDSEYLEKTELHLLRLRPIAEDTPRNTRPDLSKTEAADLMPRYKEAQLHGSTERGKARIKKQRADIIEKADEIITPKPEVIENAQTERDGMLWLLDNGVKIDNVIYYNHTQRFCFGWLKPIKDEIKSELLDILCEFPFDYDIK